MHTRSHSHTHMHAYCFKMAEFDLALKPGAHWLCHVDAALTSFWYKTHPGMTDIAVSCEYPLRRWLPHLMLWPCFPSHHGLYLHSIHYNKQRHMIYAKKIVHTFQKINHLSLILKNRLHLNTW